MKPITLELKIFDIGLALFQHHFPQVKFEDYHANAWYSTLKSEIDNAIYEKAVREVCKRPSWFPTDNFAGKILEAATELGRQNWGSPERERPELPPHDPCTNNLEFDAAMKQFSANFGKLDPTSRRELGEAQKTMDRIQNAER